MTLYIVIFAVVTAVTVAFLIGEHLDDRNKK